MVYCSNCGQKLEENFNFCPKCGVKTKVGAAAGVPEPWEVAVRGAFFTAGEEMRKAFQKAGEEIRKASTEVRKEVQARRAAKSAACPNCGANNPSEAKFCSKCGKTLS
jgi:predicted amidophosphoribosyltransferase